MEREVCREEERDICMWYGAGVICKRDCKLVIDALGWLDYYFSKERKLVVVVLSIAHHLPTKNYHPCLSPP